MSYSARNMDYNRAKIAAYIVVAGFMGLMFVFGVRSASGPELHDGDRVESLTCPLCKGSGVGKEAGTRCQACLGSKKLKAVLPGPHHPVEIRGTVRNLSAFKDLSEGERLAEADAREKKVSLTPVKGAIPGAKVVFQGTDSPTEFTAKANGKFWGIVKPGNYTLTVSAPGYTKKEETFTVEPRENPVWPDAAGVESLQQDTLQLDLFLIPH